jgi:glycosyltransferase involved in cell wall biosynthesis
MRICRVATVPFFLLHHLGEQIAATAHAGHEVVLVSSPGPEVSSLQLIPGVSHHAIPITRQISVFRDLVTLWRLVVFFRRQRFDLVHSTTPKAGLLAALAARLTGVPIRLHTFTGQAWAERHDWVRRMAKACDRVIIGRNTRCYADSFSQRDFLVEQGVARAGQIDVLGRGSLAGVDLSRFKRERRLEAATMKAWLGIPSTSLVVGFVGRVTKDKGIVELTAAFDLLDRLGCPDVHLVLVGPLEPERDPLPPDLVERIAGHDRIHMVGYTPTPENFVAAFDLFCLPSYREGFGNVVIEAAAMGIPAVGTQIAGLADAIVDQLTGLLVPPKNVSELADALARLLRDGELRQRMGDAAERRALRDFDSRKINAATLAEYEGFRREGSNYRLGADP